MTLKEIAASGKEMLTPTDVAQVLGCNPYSINVMAKKDPEALGFPVCRIGNRVKIPRLSFLRWAGCEEVGAHGQDGAGSGSGGV